ncbi:MAG: glutamine amidotransferase [Limisphaerales bacterium]
MPLASLAFARPDWLWPAAALLAAGLALLVWSYVRGPRGWTRWACARLEFLGLALHAACLVEPQWTGRRARTGANLFAVVADNSGGLGIRDAGETRTRGEQLREQLGGDWMSRLAEDFDVRRYLFDTRLQGTRDFAELDFAGRATALGSSLRALAERHQGRPLAGVLLFTDGNATDLPAGLPDLAGLPPVFPVVVGRRDAVRDLAVQQVGVTTSAFEDAPVTVQADAAASGFAGQAAVARLVDPAGREVARQNFRGADAPVALRFPFKPEEPGLSFYRLEVAAAAEAGRPPGDTNSAEATLANNARVLAVERGGGPYRVLYVAGRPNWEFKFLNRAVQADPQVQLVALIRVANREPKFEFRGRAGETSNPLFRGFGDQSREAAERYDQPVLTRLNTRDELELRSGFPGTPEELFAYDAVIVDDLEAAFFTPDQAALLQRFVAHRGGGFLMLGGMESLREGGYHRTPVGDMLPVYLDRAPVANPPEPVRLELDREGWLEPWARLRDTESAERDRLAAMPAFEVLNRVGGVKPGARVIATVATRDGPQPALAVQRFGRGRTGALTIGDVWRWGMQDEAARADMDKAWRQLVRWLVTDVPRRVELTAVPVAADPNGAVRLQARARDARFEPLDTASVALVVEPVAFAGDAAPATNVITLRAEPSLSEPGLYEAAYVPRLAGGYRATAVVTNTAGLVEGRAEAGWSTDPAAAEFRSLVPNVALLEDLARRTGGEVVAATRLDEFVRGLPTRAAPVTEPWSRPLWHTPWMFGAALGCLLAGWGMRRWKGMP